MCAITGVVHAAHVDDDVEAREHRGIAGAHDLRARELGGLAQQEAAQGLVAVEGAAVGADGGAHLALVALCGGGGGGHAVTGGAPG